MRYDSLDIERLHRVIESINNHQPTARAEGRTTAFLVLMANEMLLGDPGQTYVYVGENYAMSTHVCKTLADFVTGLYGRYLLTAVKPAAREICTVTDQRFLFFTPSTDICRVRGTTVARVFCDVQDHDKRGRILADLVPTVQNRGGDLLY